MTVASFVIQWPFNIGHCPPLSYIFLVTKFEQSKCPVFVTECFYYCWNVKKWNCIKIMFLLSLSTVPWRHAEVFKWHYRSTNLQPGNTSQNTTNLKTTVIWPKLNCNFSVLHALKLFYFCGFDLTCTCIFLSLKLSLCFN